MDHIWKTIGILGFEILELCSSHPVPYHYHKDALEAEVPGALLGVAILLVSVVCLIACICCKERRNGFKEFRDSSHSIHQAGLAFTNPTCGLAPTPASELSIFPPLGATPVTFEPLPSLATLSPRARRPPGYHCQPVGELDDWFTKEDADFPRHQLQFLKDCGRGWFGRVVEGEARGFSDSRYKVMVRILREDATPAEQRLFLGEVKPYRDLNHRNVLKMVGRCLETHPYLVLLEACSAGDLKSFLCSDVTSSNVLVEKGVCLSIMCQVTEGLRHMIKHGFVHTDLAARNCQVTSDLTVKVGDYGTSIDKYKDEYYIAGDIAVPVRWCAPETLHCTDTTIETKQVTPEANVWSLGILLWEVCQFGQMPYSDLTDDQVIVRVLGNESVRLPPPALHSLHSGALYSLMAQCWSTAPARPSLDHVLAMLRHLHSSHSEEDFQRRWDALKPPEVTLETMTARSDFDSGVDLEIKSTDRDILDLVKKSSSDVNLSPGTSSPQLSVTSSSGGEFFSQTSLAVLKKQQSPSMTNLHGSVEDVATSRPAEGERRGNKETEEFDSWLKGVETTTEEDVKFVKKISEAIKDLDDALALEKTSSSSDDSSRQESPMKDSDKNPVLDFRLGPMSSTVLGMNMQPDSLQDSLARRDSSGTDTEEETWRGRIERGEFSEKVKEKSKSVTDLMILTHIESEGSESDSLPSLTRQYSAEKGKRKFSGVISTIGFGSEGNIRGAVLGEEFQDALKQLQAEWKLRDMESRESSLQFVKNEVQSSQQQDNLDFLSNDASEKPLTPPQNVVQSPTPLSTESVPISCSEIVEAKIINNSLQGCAPASTSFEEESAGAEISENEVEKQLQNCEHQEDKSTRVVHSPETSDLSQNTESSSEISTPTQIEVIATLDHVQSFLDSERAFIASSKVKNIDVSEQPNLDMTICVKYSDTDRNVERSASENIVPNNFELESCPKNKILNLNCDIFAVSNCNVSVGDGLVGDTVEPSDSVHVGENLLRNVHDHIETEILPGSSVINNDSKISEPVERHNEAESINVPVTVNDFLFLKDEKESSTFVPEIVVTEASILDVESDSESELVLPNTTPVRRNIRLVMSSSDDSESEDDNKVLENITLSDSHDLRSAGIVTSTPFVRERRCVSEDESVSEVDPTFPETETESFFVRNTEKPVMGNEEESSVILGSCEDYTLDYFKGLKTTFGKQTSDESTDEFSKSEDEREDEKPLNNWDEFLADTNRQRYHQNPADSELEDNDLDLNDKNREENSAFDFSDENINILNPKIQFNEHFNKSVKKHVMICDRMDIFDNLSGKHDQDQQMEEIKNRLEDVAKLSESFCLKNHTMTTEEDDDGKLLTPDDERSSDSGFRDKGSLSESVEDACDEKYNLEDIEAELEQGEESFDKTFTVSEDGKRNEDELTASTIKSSDSSSLSQQTSGEEAESLTRGKDEKQERFNKLDNALESDIDRFFDMGKTKTGWYLHPPPGPSLDDGNGWLPSAPEEGKESEYRNLDINEEFVTAIRNELREKLPCAQNPERTENEEDVSPEEERTDLVIQYNTYPVPLSPIFEERESISSNQSSLLLDETGKSIESSGKSSPILYLDVTKEGDNSRFEDDIKNSLDICNSESTESDNVLVTVEDLEDSRGEKAQKVKENPKEEMEDLLIVDTETNKVILYESPRPKSQLAFVKQVLDSVENSPINSETYTFYHSADDNILSVDRNNLTCTPDSCTLSPMSSGSSRTGAAVSFSSSETGGNLSGFYLSPSSVRSDLFDNGPPSLPFDLGQNEPDQIVEPVEEIKLNNEAEEIVQELVEAGVLKEDDIKEEIKISELETKETQEVENLETEIDTMEESTSVESSLGKSESESSESNLSTVVNGSFNSNVLQICNIQKKNDTNCDKIDELLSSENVQLQVPEGQLDFSSNSQEWLKSVLLSGSSLPEAHESPKNDGVLVSLNPNNWPRAEELLPAVKCEQVSVATPDSPSMDLLEVAAKFYDVNSTLAISTPNNTSFDESKDNSQLSSFTSTPTVESKSIISKPFEKPSEADMKCIPSLSSLASEILLRFPPSEDSSPDGSSERTKRLQGMTLALETPMISKAPMPSPEDADKGSWRPTMNQLMELTSRPEAEDMMTTSFIDTDNDNNDDEHDNYAPDWESDTSDDSEDHSSSSGEFIWRDGDKEEAITVVIACDDLEPQEGVSERSMARISEGEEEEEEEEEGEDSSSCGSTTEFIPSTWDRNATPTKSALRSAEKQKGAKRNVSFKRQKYHCVYEYPREPCSDDEGSSVQRPSWQSPSTYDYSTYTDWEYGEGEVESDEEDEDNSGPRQLVESEYDFYRLSNLDFDMMTQMNLDDGEFFISSSARPFQMADSSQFFPGSLGFNDEDFLVEFQPCAADTEAIVIPASGQTPLDETINTELREVEPKKMEKEKTKQKPEELQLTADLSGESTPAEVSPTLGELRHTRERLKLDLGRADSGGEDSGVGSSDKLDEVGYGELSSLDKPDQDEDSRQVFVKSVQVEDSRLGSLGKPDQDEDTRQISVRSVLVEDNRVRSSDKPDQVEDSRLRSLDKPCQDEDSRQVFVKSVQVEDSRLRSLDKPDQDEDSNLGSSSKLYQVEDSRLRSSDKPDQVEDNRLRSSDKPDQDEDTRQVSVKSVQVEGCRLKSSDNPDHVSGKSVQVEDGRLKSNEEHSKLGSTGKSGEVEDVRMGSSLGAHQIEVNRVQFSDYSDQVKDNRPKSSVNSDQVEDSRLMFLEKLVQVADSGLERSLKLDHFEEKETTSEA